MAIHQVPEQFLSALVLDGVLEAHPDLRGGCIEQGAMWVVPWLRRLDLAQRTFSRTEPTLRDLPLRASEYVHRQLRFTPFPGEPVGWMIEQCGDDLFLFSSDYPHPEGTKDPVARFEATMDCVTAEARDRLLRTELRRHDGDGGRSGLTSTTVSDLHLGPGPDGPAAATVAETHSACGGVPRRPGVQDQEARRPRLPRLHDARAPGNVSWSGSWS